MTSPNKSPDAKTIESDARGQFANVKEGGKSSGVASAKPTVITGSEDATAHKIPPGTPAPEKEWEANFDVAEHPTDR